MSKDKPPGKKAPTREEIERTLRKNKEQKISASLEAELKRQGYTLETAPKSLIARLFIHQVRAYKRHFDSRRGERDDATIDRAVRARAAKAGVPKPAPHSRPRRYPRT